MRVVGGVDLRPYIDHQSVVPRRAAAFLGGLMTAATVIVRQETTSFSIDSLEWCQLQIAGLSSNTHVAKPLAAAAAGNIERLMVIFYGVHLMA